MALAVLARKNVKATSLMFQAVRNAGHWNYEWRADSKAPQTEEEMKAAAKKYGLIRPDYKPYPDDGTGFGDYPDLPIISAESRNQQDLFDFPDMKRNYGEPLHIEADMYLEDKLDYNRKWQFSKAWHWYSFLGTMAGAALLFYLGQNVRVVDVKILKRHEPFDGTKHYSFELEKLD